MATFKAEFNTKVGDADYGEILLYLFTTGEPNTGQVRFKVTDPTGVVIKDFPAANGWDYEIPGVVPTGYTLAASVDIPITGSGDEFVAGTYTIEGYYEPAGSPNGSEILSEIEYYFAPNGSVDDDSFGTLTAAVNCRTAKVTFTDDTDHTDWTKSTWNLIVQPPLIPGSAAPSPVTETDGEVELTFSYTNVTYSGTLYVVRTKTTEVDEFDVVEAETVTAAASIFIDCGNGLCDLIQCLNSDYDKVDDLACANGGWDRVPAKTLASLYRRSILTNLYDLNSRCGNTDKAVEYKNTIASLYGDCNCGCTGDSTTATPRPYSP